MPTYSIDFFESLLFHFSPPSLPSSSSDIISHLNTIIKDDLSPIPPIPIKPPHKKQHFKSQSPTPPPFTSSIPADPLSQHKNHIRSLFNKLSTNPSPSLLSQFQLAIPPLLSHTDFLFPLFIQNKFLAIPAANIASSFLPCDLLPSFLSFLQSIISSVPSSPPDPVQNYDLFCSYVSHKDKAQAATCIQGVLQSSGLCPDDSQNAPLTPVATSSLLKENIEVEPSLVVPSPKTI